MKTHPGILKCIPYGRRLAWYEALTSNDYQKGCGSLCYIENGAYNFDALGVFMYAVEKVPVDFLLNKKEPIDGWSKSLLVTWDKMITGALVPTGNIPIIQTYRRDIHAHELNDKLTDSFNLFAMMILPESKHLFNVSDDLPELINPGGCKVVNIKDYFDSRKK